MLVIAWSRILLPLLVCVCFIVASIYSIVVERRRKKLYEKEQELLEKKYEVEMERYTAEIERIRAYRQLQKGFTIKVDSHLVGDRLDVESIANEMGKKLKEEVLTKLD